MVAADMIRQLLTFARKDDVQLTTFDLRLFLGEAYKLARVSIEENVRCSQDLCDGPVIICGDATRIQQMLMNLLNNARDAMESMADPAILLTLQRRPIDAAMLSLYPDAEPGEYAVLSIQDNGPGIAEAQLQRIFEPFCTVVVFLSGYDRHDALQAEPELAQCRLLNKPISVQELSRAIAVSLAHSSAAKVHPESGQSH